VSVGQPNSVLTMGGGIPPDVTPKLKVTSTMPNPGQFTLMAWAYHTGGTGDTYSDVFGITDLNDVIGMSFHTANGNKHFSIGDLNSDVDGPVVPDNEWHHVCLAIGDIAGTGTRSIGYLDGLEAMSGSLINPVTPVFMSLFNSRASDTDASGCWIGNLCGFKIWNEVALTAEEIRREMWSYTPQRLNNLWGWSPMLGLAYRTHNYGGLAGQDWTSQSNWFAEGTNDPPGVVWDYPMGRRDPSGFFVPPQIFQRVCHRPFTSKPGSARFR
jgi:hypothetical protein